MNPIELHEVDKVTNSLIEDLETLLKRARDDNITGYALVTVKKGGTFSTISCCQSRLELLGALQMALHDTSNHD